VIDFVLGLLAGAGAVCVVGNILANRPPRRKICRWFNCAGFRDTMCGTGYCVEHCHRGCEDRCTPLELVEFKVKKKGEV